MGLAARNTNTGCNNCDRDHGCGCDNVVSSEAIEHGPRFCVVVNGDYQIDADDSIVHVTSDNGAVDASGNPVTPTLTLPDPCDIDSNCASITIIAQGSTGVRIDGLNDANTGATAGANNAPSNGSRLLPAFGAVTFFLTEGRDNDNCNCSGSGNFWVANRTLQNG